MQKLKEMFEKFGVNKKSWWGQVLARDYSKKVPFVPIIYLFCILSSSPLARSFPSKPWCLLKPQTSVSKLVKPLKLSMPICSHGFALCRDSACSLLLSLYSSRQMIWSTPSFMSSKWERLPFACRLSLSCFLKILFNSCQEEFTVFGSESVAGGCCLTFFFFQQAIIGVYCGRLWTTKN